MLANEVHRLLMDPVGCIIGTLETVIASWVERVRIVRQRSVTRNRRIITEIETLLITSQVRRVIAMCVTLAVVTKETVKPLVDRISF